MMALGTTTRNYMTASEAAAIFTRGLDEELGLATAHRFDGGSGDERTPQVMAAAYRIASRLDPDVETMTTEMLDAYTEGFSDRDKRAVVLMLKALAPQQAAHKDATAMLVAIGAPVSSATVRDARAQLLLARAEAQSRAGLIEHPMIIGRTDAVARLLDDDIVNTLRGGSPAPAPQENDSPYLTSDTRRFSEIIEATITAIQTTGDWNEDMAQRRRVMEGFAWATGDKRLCDYRPADAELFAQTLMHLPISFRWGNREAGAMSRPFAEVLAEIPKAKGTEKRSPRTLNRDLTTMSRVARQLAKVAWKPKLGGAPIMNFNDLDRKSVV